MIEAMHTNSTVSRPSAVYTREHHADHADHADRPIASELNHDRTTTLEAGGSEKDPGLITSILNSRSLGPYRGHVNNVLNDGTKIDTAHQYELGELAYELHANLNSLRDRPSVRKLARLLAETSIKNGNRESYGTLNKLAMTSRSKTEKESIERFKQENGNNGELYGLRPEYKNLYHGSIHRGRLPDGTAIKPRDLTDIAEISYAMSEKSLKWDQYKENRLLARAAVEAAIKNGQTDALGTLKKLEITSQDQDERQHIQQLKDATGPFQENDALLN